MREPGEPGRDPASARALVFAAAMLGVWLVLGAFHRIGGYGVESDFYGFYGPGARQLLAGEAYTHTRSGPGYSALLALAGRAGLDLFVAAKLAAALATAALGWLSFHLARPLVGARAAHLVQALLYASLFTAGFTAGNDVPAAALSAAALLLALRREAPTHGALLGAGLCTGLATVTRFTGAAVLPVLLGWIALWPSDRPSAGRRATRAAALLLGFALAHAPVWIAYAAWHGDPFYNKAYALIALDAFGPPGDKTSMSFVVAMEDRFASLGDVLAHDPAALVRHYALDVYQDLGAMLVDLVTFPALALLGPGAWWLLARPERRRAGTWLACAAASFLAAALVPYQARYHVPHLAAAFVCVALAVERLRGEDGHGRVARAALPVLVLAAPCAMSALKTVRVLADEPREVLPAAAALAQQVEPGDALVARKPHLAFLAGARAEFPKRHDDLARFLEWLVRDSGARFLLVGPEEVRENRFLAPLADGTLVPGELTRVYAAADPPCALYLVRDP